MREIGLYGLLFGIKKTAKKFGYDETELKQLILEAFDDRFIHTYREIIKASIIQVGEKETSRAFKISLESLRIFMKENNLKSIDNSLAFLNYEEWF